MVLVLGGLNYKSVILIVFVLLAAVMSSFLISGVGDVEKTSMIIFSVVLIIVTFIDTNIGLIAILLSMLLSPELEAGATSGRAVVLRAEDLLLIIVSMTWLAKMAIRKELPFIRHSPLNAPIGLFIALMAISTLRGIILGNVLPLKGMFFILKIAEYYILYLIVLNHTTSIKQVKLFLMVLILTSVIVGIYCNTHMGTLSRMSAPFEGEGEPNTLGAYLLFILCILGGLLVYYREKRLLIFLTMLFLTPPFIFTLSRSSYLGCVPALLSFVFLSKKKNVIIFTFFIVVFSTVLVMLGPPVIKDRIMGAFEPEKNQALRSVGPVSLGPSPAARVESWTYLIKDKFPKKPILGYGVTGISFIDSQYLLVLGETGLIGLCSFLWLLWRVWRVACKTFASVERPLFKGLVLGYAAGFMGLLFHAIGSNTFIIIRISEPFWFFTAIIVKLVDIETGKADMEDKVREYMRGRVPYGTRFIEE